MFRKMKTKDTRLIHREYWLIADTMAKTILILGASYAGLTVAHKSVYPATYEMEIVTNDF